MDAAKLKRWGPCRASQSVPMPGKSIGAGGNVQDHATGPRANFHDNTGADNTDNNHGNDSVTHGCMDRPAMFKPLH